MTSVIDLDALKSTELLSLGRYGSVEVREMSGADEHALHAAIARPGRAQPTAFATELLGRSCGLTCAQIQALSAAARRRIVAALVRVNDWDGDWRALYGSWMTTDERLLAVAHWDYTRTRAAVLLRIRDLRRQQMQAVEDRAATLGSSQLASAAAAVAKAQQFSAGMRAAREATSAMSNLRSVLGLGETASTLLAATRPNPVFVAARPPAFMGALGQAPQFGGALAGLERSRAQVAASAAGLRVAVGPLSRGIGAGPLSRGIAGAHSPVSGWARLGRAGWAEAPRLVAMSRISDVMRQTMGPQFGQTLGARLGLGSVLAGFDALGAWRGHLEVWEITARFMTTWENHPLWFLFEALGLGASAKLAKLRHKDVEPVVFDALERVFSDDELLDAFIAQLSAIVDLEGPQRDQMRQTLEFVRSGQYHLAQPLLHAAFEAMLFEATVRQGLAPRREGRFVAAEKLLVQLFESGDLLLRFTKLIVFGAGNAQRHGRRPDGHREVVLAGLVALAGYMDWDTGTAAVEVVAGRLERELGPTIERREAELRPVLTVAR